MSPLDPTGHRPRGAAEGLQYAVVLDVLARTNGGIRMSDVEKQPVVRRSWIVGLLIIGGALVLLLLALRPSSF